MASSWTDRWPAICATVTAIVLAACAGAWGAKQVGANADTSDLTVFIGQSELIDAPWQVARVSITDPAIADVQVLSPRQVLLQGKAVGSTDLILWGEGEQAWKARVRVTADLQSLADELVGMFPGSRLKLSQAQNVVIVSGQLARVEHAAQLGAFLGASGLEYLDMTSVAGVQQVLLKVRVAEVSRSALRALGFNAFLAKDDFFGGINIGSSAGPLNPTSIGVPEGAPVGDLPFQFTEDVTVRPGVTLFGGFPNCDLEFFLQALAENQYLRILAEPNLVALSGETATFLAGGEFPIPVIQGGLAAGTSITVEYKEFGVRLAFSPIVLGDGSIRLVVAPEVSQLSDVGAVEIQGFRIPALLTRRAKTTLEMKSGQSFAMAGLISRTNTARTSRVTGLGDVPILGALFRSVRYERGETELLVLVTAELVEPMSVDGPLPVPGVLHKEPDAWELYSLGTIESTQQTLVPADQQARLDRLSGLYQLKGPGAWQEYDQPAARSRAEADGETQLQDTAARPEAESVQEPAPQVDQEAPASDAQPQEQPATTGAAESER